MTAPRALLALAAAAFAAALAAGCPLPQPLAEVARTPDGGSVSTPILLPDTASPGGSTIYVTRDCATGAQFTLTMSGEDFDTAESVEARWFVNYTSVNTGYRGSTDVTAATDPSNPGRTVQPFTFIAYQAGETRPAGAVEVVEVVISNNFLGLGDPTPPFQRAAPPPYVTQSYRWVFQFLDATDARATCP
jgi:hypothetical protein